MFSKVYNLLKNENKIKNKKYIITKYWISINTTLSI